MAPEQPLAERLASAAPGDRFCLAPGMHRGPLRIPAGVEVRGPRSAVIASAGRGSTVLLAGRGAALRGVTVDGSGSRFDLLDAAVRVAADGCRVEGVRVVRALFGILAEQARGLLLRDNEVVGLEEKPLGLRGDGIRLWEVRASRIEGNRLVHSRDLVVWYSPGNVFRDNRVEHGRYGTHFMYSHDNRVEGNLYLDNVVGIFVMYSRGVEIRGNTLARSAGAAGMGIGSKESGSLAILENRILANHVGLYLDTSPLRPDEPNRIEGNEFRFCDTAVVFHGVAAGNRFTYNRFRDNGLPVRSEGRGDARDAIFRRNEWGDYAGYDLDGDGIGDLPYVLRSLEHDLTRREPALRFFRGTPAMMLVELVGRVVPLFEPRTLLVDPEPLLGPPAKRSAPAHGA